MEKHTVLLVNENENGFASLERFFRGAGYETRTVSTSKQALQVMAERPPDVVISGQQIKGETGVRLLTRVRQDYPDVVRILLTSRANVDAAIAAVNEGVAHHFFTQPEDNDEINLIVRQALYQRDLVLGDRRPDQTSYRGRPLPELGVSFIPEPEKLVDLGVSRDLVSELALKEIYFAGRITAIAVKSALAIPFPLTQVVLDFLKRESLIHVVGSQGPLLHLDELSLTERGRMTVEDALSRSRYRGPVPVPLDQYCKVVREQSLRNKRIISRDELERGLSHLVLKQNVLDLLGPALKSWESIFLYGPPGDGKTTIATSLGELLGGSQLIPHAVYVAGHIIKVFDPIVHQALAPGDAQEGDTDASRHNYRGPRYRRDERWVICTRPTVIAGGELTLARLELQYDEHLGYYQAPLQMKANGGVLLIDDFGRQHAPPRDILNRWIIPMDRGVDYLHLRSGETIEVPFNLLLIFATNLRPAQLLDEALLRRLQYKILIPDPGEEEFREIFRRAAADKNLTIEEDVLDYFIGRYYVEEGRQMRGCHPIAIIKYADDIRLFQERSDGFSRELLDLAAQACFVTG